MKRQQQNQPSPFNASAVLALAVQHHQAGRLDAARQLYGQILHQRPQHLDALHLFGIAEFQSGRFEPAIALYQQAIALKPNFTEAHVHLAHALQAAGQKTEAIAHYQKALQLDPNLADVHLNLANLLVNHQRQQAMTHYEQAIACDPKLVEAHYNLGRVYEAEGQVEQAIAQYRHAIAQKPDYVQARNNLGNLLLKHNNLDDAIEQLQIALNLHSHPGIANNLGNAFKAKGNDQQAIAFYQQALRLQPNFAQAHNNLGDLYRDCQQLARAIEHFEQAIALQPNLAEAHSNLGMTLLLAGDFKRGFAEYEWRWRCADLVPRPFSQPLWDGSELHGRRILLHAEQGFGDAIQFVRYVPLVKARGGHVIVECPEPLVRLFSTVAGIDELVAKDSPLPGFQVHAPFLSLPYILGTTLETIPAEIPYLSPPSSSAVALYIPEEAELKVGVVWAGSPTHKNDRHRSCPFSEFARLLKTPGVAFYSLQKGERAADLNQLSPDIKVQDLSDQLHDFADTAAAIAQLDLVITVDTSVAHLAGALGQTVWVLLSSVPDWRWMLEREDSPWYPTMRLIRQPNPGDWQGLLNTVM